MPFGGFSITASARDVAHGTEKVKIIRRRTESVVKGAPMGVEVTAQRV
jgi:hypothetical protein